MAWIRMIAEKDATGLLAKIYEKLRAPWGGMDHILKVHSLNPRSLERHHAYYNWIMRGTSPLTKDQREMIAVVVSTTNRCEY